MKFCFAGVGTRQNLIDLFYTTDYLLESFFYIKEWQMDFLKTRKLFLLDSGAFSFINTGKRTDWHHFADKYGQFVKDHNIKNYFELDIDQIIGVGPTRKLRDRLEKRVGWQSIPVWHTVRGTGEWENLCKEYDYVSTSLSGFTDTSRWFRKNKHAPLKYFLDISQRHNTKVHGLGFTAIPKLHEHSRLYSVDSTSWLMGTRAGFLAVFRNGRMERIAKGDGQRLAIDKREAIDRNNFNEWLKFQKYAEAKLV